MTGMTLQETTDYLRHHLALADAPTPWSQTTPPRCSIRPAAATPAPSTTSPYRPCWPPSPPTRASSTSPPPAPPSPKSRPSEHHADNLTTKPARHRPAGLPTSPTRSPATTPTCSRRLAGNSRRRRWPRWTANGQQAPRRDPDRPHSRADPPGRRGGPAPLRPCQGNRRRRRPRPGRQPRQRLPALPEQAGAARRRDPAVAMWCTTTSIGPTARSGRPHHSRPSSRPLRRRICGSCGSIDWAG